MSRVQPDWRGFGELCRVYAIFTRTPRAELPERWYIAFEIGTGREVPPEEPGAGAGNAGRDGAVVAAWEAPRAVPVEVVTAVKKKVPVRVDLLGTVTPIASVAVKTRVGHPGQGRAGYGLAIHS